MSLSLCTVKGPCKIGLKMEPNLCWHWQTEIVCSLKTIRLIDLYMKSKNVPHKILSKYTSGFRKNKSKNFSRTGGMLLLTTKILITVYFDNSYRSYTIEHHGWHYV